MATTLNRLSTLDDVLDAYYENADYDLGAGSITKAQLFVKAIRLWIAKNPERVTHGGRGGEEVALPVKAMTEQLKAAEEWLQSAYVAEGSRKFMDFSEYRS